MSATHPDEKGIPDLVRDLVRVVLGLTRSTARMFGLEAREIVQRLGRRVALLIACSVVAGAGVVLLLASLAIVLETVAHLPRWAGLAIVGLFALGAGAAGVSFALRRLGEPDLAFPVTMGELSKDVDALTGAAEEP